MRPGLRARIDRARMDRALRRAVPALGIGIMLLLLAIPAVEDLRRLFVGVGLLAIAIAVVTGLYTWFDTTTPRRQDNATGE